MKKGKYFSYKEKKYTAYNYFKKKKIVAILKGVNKDNNN